MGSPARRPRIGCATWVSEIATAEQMTPAGFAAFIRDDYQHMGEAAKLAGITPK